VAVGGKARSLVRLARSGLRTPAGFVITDELFRALRAGGPSLPVRLDQAALATLGEAAAALDAAPLPPGFEQALVERLAALDGDRFSVRSSFASEDRYGALAPGIYQSRIGVRAAEIVAAVRAVLRSALAPGALAYALAHGLTPADPPVAVLVHRHVPATATGSAAFDAAAGEASAVVSARQGRLSAAAVATIERALLELSADHGGVELEWAATGDEVTFLQLRPYRATRPAPWPGEHQVRPPWRWDAAHNPLPLSPAQAGLVALVDEHCQIGVRQRVVSGYLFHAPAEPPAHGIAPEDASAALAALRSDTEVRLALLGPGPPLEDALALFLSAYQQLFGVIQPAARAGRQGLAGFLAQHLPEQALAPLLAGVDSMARERRVRADRLAATGGTAHVAALAEYLALFGDEAPAWDVSVPTYRESPAALMGAATRSRTDEPAVNPRAARDEHGPPSNPFARLPPATRAEGEGLLAVARAAVAAGEDDDWLYARIQAAVRRALLALGQRLHAAGVLDGADDIFFCPLDRARAVAASAAPPTAWAAGEPVTVPVTAPDIRALARDGRRTFEAARRRPPPSGTAAAGDSVLRGAGTGGRAVGRVWRHERGPGPADAVLVAATLLPTELPLVAAAALVVETGGPLDHVATQARERQLPAVVGVAGATRVLADGDLVLVDADQGLVVKVRGP
jgi:phosphohistidine swiveling domain-containing protein